MDKKALITLLFTLYFLLFTLNVYAGPTSGSYELIQYGFGAGGTASSSSNNYSVNGVLGESDTGKSNGTLYNIGSGLNFTQQADVPPAPNIDNPSNFYNKLQLTINPGPNPNDSEFAISISSDAFVSDTKYIQSDHTISTQLNDDDWQTYTAWGGASGFEIIGLTPGTTYTVKVAARQGWYTQTGYGPTDSAATSDPSISFDIDVSSIDTETAPPYTLNFGSVSLGSVNTASNRIWMDIDTNAESGGYVYIYSANNGLLSAHTSHTISSVTGNLAALSEGFGIQNNSATQTSGGPLTALSPYDGAADNVGIVNSTIRELYSTGTNPIVGGRASVTLKMKPSANTPASSDYSDTLTLIAAGTF